MRCKTVAHGMHRHMLGNLCLSNRLFFAGGSAASQTSDAAAQRRCVCQSTSPAKETTSARPTSGPRADTSCRVHAAGTRRCALRGGLPPTSTATAPAVHEAATPARSVASPRGLCRPCHCAPRLPAAQSRHPSRADSALRPNACLFHTASEPARPQHHRPALKQIALQPQSAPRECVCAQAGGHWIAARAGLDQAPAGGRIGVRFQLNLISFSKLLAHTSTGQKAHNIVRNGS